MTTRTRATVAAGFLAVGILVGAAGTITVRDATTTDFADQMRMTASVGSMGSMTSMMSMMDAGHMADMTSMMSMMDAGHMAEMSSMMGGAGSSMMPNASMAPDGFISPEDHLKHHASPSPAATR